MYLIGWSIYDFEPEEAAAASDREDGVFEGGGGCGCCCGGWKGCPTPGMGRTVRPPAAAAEVGLRMGDAVASREERLELHNSR